MVKLRILILLFALAGAGVKAQAGDYKLVKKDDGVSLYEKWITAMNGEQARELKVVFVVNASPAQALALLKDQSKGPEWNPQADVFRIIPATESSWVSYVRYDIPWPVGDQDCCLQYTVKPAPGATEVHFQSTTHSLFPVKSGVGRIAGTRGKWVLENSGGKQTKVTYTITANRNNKLPKFITDPIIHDNMLESMALFTSLLENN
ncbi:MAG: hypothetical protein JNL72_08365 [Flavipsychrobacter sp.]|nr:hypothetical protein [Flavipsychrobacter sp.]